MQLSIRVAACGFAVTMLVATLSAATDGSRLEWRSGGKSAKRHVASDGLNGVRTAGRESLATARSASINPLRGSRQYVDSAVRRAGFEEEAGPRFAETTVESAPARSVVVERDAAQDELRSAQLSSPGGAESAPGGAAGTVPGATAPADTLTPPADLSTPAIDTTELPPLDEPPATGIESPLPGTEPTPPQAPVRQPVEPPARQPSTQIQPRVPAAPGGGEGVRPGAELPAVPPLNEATIQAEREKSEKACDEGFEDLRAKTIDKVSLNIAVSGEEGSDFPFECTLGDGEWHGGRCWEQTTYMWKASALCHKPLYFEDEQLERYGHSFSPCFQPFISGAHFFTRPFVLPYCMGVEPPTECIYALGHYRPGNCAPYMCNPIPISGRGALFQAGAVVGAAAALP